MISLVAQGINLLVDSVVCLLAISAYIGQTIVTLLAGTFNFIAGLFSFLGQVYEDNRNLFALEVPSMVFDAPNVIITHFSEAADFFGTIASGFHSSVVNPIIISANFILLSLYHSAGLIKNFFIIVGDSLWIIITFIPVYLPGLVRTMCGLLFEALIGGAKAAYSSLLRVTNYLTDIPLQSTAGIIFAVIIVRIILDFQVEIMSLISRVYRSTVTGLIVYYYSVYNYFMDEEMRIINQLVGDRRPVVAGGEEVQDERHEREALCIVCQERQKCMLILPCRHICLCCECCVRLYNYQRTCPICRTFICHSVNVYI